MKRQTYVALSLGIAVWCITGCGGGAGPKETEDVLVQPKHDDSSATNTETLGWIGGGLTGDESAIRQLKDALQRNDPKVGVVVRNVGKALELLSQKGPGADLFVYVMGIRPRTIPVWHLLLSLQDRYYFKDSVNFFLISALMQDMLPGAHIPDIKPIQTIFEDRDASFLVRMRAAELLDWFWNTFPELQSSIDGSYDKVLTESYNKLPNVSEYLKMRDYVLIPLIHIAGNSQKAIDKLQKMFDDTSNPVQKKVFRAVLVYYEGVKKFYVGLGPDKVQAAASTLDLIPLMPMSLNQYDEHKGILVWAKPALDTLFDCFLADPLCKQAIANVVSRGNVEMNAVIFSVIDSNDRLVNNPDIQGLMKEQLTDALIDHILTYAENSPSPRAIEAFGLTKRVLDRLTVLADQRTGSGKEVSLYYDLGIRIDKSQTMQKLTDLMRKTIHETIFLACAQKVFTEVERITVGDVIRLSYWSRVAEDSHDRKTIVSLLEQAKNSANSDVKTAAINLLQKFKK